jgi:hypothetical protein
VTGVVFQATLGVSVVASSKTFDNRLRFFKKKMQGLLVIMMALIAGQVTGHPHGAPTTACNTMFPLHKHHPQTSACPFETRPYQVNSIRNNLKIQMRIPLFIYF